MNDNEPPDARPAGRTVVLLVGPQGAGKTTWCRENLPATTPKKTQRGPSPPPPRRHGYRTRIVWLNADRNLCLRRCRERTDHPTLSPEDAEKALALYFNTFQVPSRREADVLDIIGPPPRFVPVTDITPAIGPRRHLIVGDVHGCLDELLR